MDERIGEIVVGKLGDIIREERRKRGWTIAMMLGHTNTHFSTGHIADIENNKVLPSLYLLIKLAHVLNLNAQDLFDIYKEDYLKRAAFNIEGKYTAECCMHNISISDNNLRKH